MAFKIFCMSCTFSVVDTKKSLNLESEVVRLMPLCDTGLVISNFHT